MNEVDSQVTIRDCHGPTEYPELVGIWHSAVKATHDFLKKADFERIESNLASAYFPAVTLRVAERAGKPVGFAGSLDGTLEMLFVTNESRGQGIGSALLTDAISNQGVTKVDVNEQNLGASGFYVSKGFAQVNRSEVDAEGLPYPILHLKLAIKSD